MTVQLLHVSDPHFGSLANIEHIEALEAMIPDLRPDAVVITGDVSQRARGVFAAAPPGQARVLALHHNVLRGEISGRMGLARWRRAQRRIAACGAEVVLCGHDHQEDADVLDGRVVVSTASTLCRRTRGGRAPGFNFVTIDPTAVHITFFRWDGDGKFRASDTAAFARGGAAQAQTAPAALR